MKTSAKRSRVTALLSGPAPPGPPFRVQKTRCSGDNRCCCSTRQKQTGRLGRSARYAGRSLSPVCLSISERQGGRCNNGGVHRPRRIPCLGLNGGPAFKHSEAFSFHIATDDQAETDRYWNAIVGNGGQESACGTRTAGAYPGRSLDAR